MQAVVKHARNPHTMALRTSCESSCVRCTCISMRIVSDVYVKWICQMSMSDVYTTGHHVWKELTTDVIRLLRMLCICEYVSNQRGVYLSHLVCPDNHASWTLIKLTRPNWFMRVCVYKRSYGILTLGANTDSEASCTPIEAKLLNPHNAYVDRTTDRSSSSPAFCMYVCLNTCVMHTHTCLFISIRGSRICKIHATHTDTCIYDSHRCMHIHTETDT
jgi:hypothetical protein